MENNRFMIPGCQDLEQEELRDVRGGLGFAAAVGVGICVAMVQELIRDWGNFKNGIGGRCVR